MWLEELRCDSVFLQDYSRQRSNSFGVRLENASPGDLGLHPCGTWLQGQRLPWGQSWLKDLVGGKGKQLGSLDLPRAQESKEDEICCGGGDILRGASPCCLRELLSHSSTTLKAETCSHRAQVSEE